MLSNKEENKGKQFKKTLVLAFIKYHYYYFNWFIAIENALKDILVDDLVTPQLVRDISHGISTDEEGQNSDHSSLGMYYCLLFKINYNKNELHF